MSEYERFLALLRMPNSDRAVLLLTFGLTVLVDLTVAIGVGVTVASLLFMARMAESVEIDASRRQDIDRDSEDLDQRDALRSEEHTSELQSLMRHSYAVFCLKKKENH